MPLHLIFQCCKCKGYLTHDLWSITRNHKYTYSKYACNHFNIIIDHESIWGFRFAWRNEIKIKADTKIVINKTFKRDSIEYQN